MPCPGTFMMSMALSVLYNTSPTDYVIVPSVPIPMLLTMTSHIQRGNTNTHSTGKWQSIGIQKAVKMVRMTHVLTRLARDKSISTINFTLISDNNECFGLITFVLSWCSGLLPVSIQITCGV